MLLISRPPAARSMTTRYSAVVPPGRVSVLGRLPPSVAEAPVPSRNTTRFAAGSQDAWSSPGASVFGPVPGPSTIRSDPGR